MNDLRHLAIIMDGNRRFAKKNKLAIKIGYKMGAKKVEELITWVKKAQIKTLTLYAFSTENWSRPKGELGVLFTLLHKYLDENLATFMEENIKLKCIGDLARLEPALQEKIAFFEAKTANNSSLELNLALSYGFKDELVRAVKRVVLEGLPISEENITSKLDLSKDVDLLVRVGGKHRLSNFLLWQSSYAQIAFCDTLFPAFTKLEFDKILAGFKTCERSFGR